MKKIGGVLQMNLVKSNVAVIKKGFCINAESVFFGGGDGDKAVLADG